jgi:predicted transcriptional regulator of viral defense system
MNKEKEYNYLEQYVLKLQSDGRLSFSLDEIRNQFSSSSEIALKFALNRLSKKNKIVSVYKGFYVIIPPEYSNRKILPPELFIDSLFKFLERPYYLGLLSAAALHGAAHQQPQESYVFINKPPLRSTKVEGIKINYVVKSLLPKVGIEKRKTETGYINISSAELTAIDLVEYQHRVGGLSRVATILHELTEAMSPEKLNDVLQNKFSLSSLQRLGYLLDCVLNKNEFALVIQNHLADKKIFRVPLSSTYKKIGLPVPKGKTNLIWKVIENIKIETDFD